MTRLPQPTGKNGDSTPYVLVGCARSGTTSLARIFDASSNGTCVIEPAPNLNREARLQMEGRLVDAEPLLNETVVDRLRNAPPGTIYGEKNVTYGPFLARLQAMSGCRVVYIHRDGRDVVRSLINWHDRKFGSIYRECADPGALAPAAISAAANLPVALDSSDFSRPRPAPGSPLGRRWPGLSRMEMCAYYWAASNQQYLDALANLADGDWISVDYTKPKAESVLRAASFLGLEGLTPERVQTMLAQRINSLADRGEADVGAYPQWTAWSGRQREQFEAFASETMQSLGYWSDRRTRWRPQGYGEVWALRAADLEWYEWMFSERRRMHEDMLAWIEGLKALGEGIDSLMDFGCGLGVGYTERLANKRYVGIDISHKNIEWCREHRNNPRHEYHCIDMISEHAPATADVVFSSGTIDNTYDIDAFLEAMVRASNKWIYLTCYRGWFDRLESHTYSYNEDHACFYNEVSVNRVIDHLRALGCVDIEARPIRTGNRDIPFEARFLARVRSDAAC